MLAALCPIVSNGLIVGAVLSYVWALPLLLTMAEVAIGEVGAVIIGFVMLAALKKVDLTKYQ